MSTIKPTWLLPDSLAKMSQRQLRLLEDWMAVLFKNQNALIFRIIEFIRDHPVETGDGYWLRVYDLSLMIEVTILTSDEAHQASIFEGMMLAEDRLSDGIDHLSGRFSVENERLTSLWLADAWQKTGLMLDGKFARTRFHSTSEGFDLKDFFYPRVGDVEPADKTQETVLTEEELLLRTCHYLRHDTTYSWLLINENDSFVEIGLSRTQAYRGFGQKKTTHQVERKRGFMICAERLAAAWFREAILQGYRCIPYPPDFQQVNLIDPGK